MFYVWQDGRSVEVCNSFEMSYKEQDGKIKYDKDYFEVKQEQCASCRGVAPPPLPAPSVSSQRSERSCLCANRI